MGGSYSEEQSSDNAVSPEIACLVYAAAGHSDYSKLDDWSLDQEDCQRDLVGGDGVFPYFFGRDDHQKKLNQEKRFVASRSQTFGRANSQSLVRLSTEEEVPAWVLAAQLDGVHARQNGDGHQLVTQKIDKDSSDGMRCRSCCSGLQRLLLDPYKGKSPSVTLHMDTPSTSSNSSSSSHHSSKPIKEEDDTRTDNFHNATSSGSRMMQHIVEASWSPTLCLYDASVDPHSGEESPAEPRRAYHIPVSGAKPCTIDNSNFTGSFVMLHRTPEAASDGLVFATSRDDNYFTGKSRRWEVRIQGRFKKQPEGLLYTGCVLEDFDYSEPHTWSAAALATVVVPLMEASMGHNFYFSWGTRGSNIKPEEEELCTITTSLAGLDQIIVTPAGEQPPNIQKDLAGAGYCRNAMARDDFKAVAQAISKRPNIEDTYTFCIWGCSPYIDCMRSQLIGMYALPDIPYGGFLGGWPAHFVLYSLPEDEQDPRHMEKNKTYFIDIMVWGSDMAVPELPERYNFLDARMLPEASGT